MTHIRQTTFYGRMYDRYRAARWTWQRFAASDVVAAVLSIGMGKREWCDRWIAQNFESLDADGLSRAEAEDLAFRDAGDLP